MERPAGHALDWNDDISAGTGAQTEGRLVDPRWVEAHELALPEEWHPADQLKRYLQALFEPDEYVAYVTESFMAADRRRPAKAAGPAPQGSSSPSWMPAAVTSARWWATVILK